MLRFQTHMHVRLMSTLRPVTWGQDNSGVVSPPVQFSLCGGDFPVSMIEALDDPSSDMNWEV